MLVYREEGTTKEEELYETIEVEMAKRPGKGLGLSIVGRKHGPGVFISDVVSSCSRFPSRSLCTSCSSGVLHALHVQVHFVHVLHIPHVRHILVPHVLKVPHLNHVLCVLYVPHLLYALFMYLSHFTYSISTHSYLHTHVFYGVSKCALRFICLRVK